MVVVDIIESGERSVISESGAVEIAEATRCCDGAVFIFVADVVYGRRLFILLENRIDELSLVSSYLAAEVT